MKSEDRTDYGATESTILFVAPPAVAAIVTDAVAGTAPAVTTTVTVVAPAGINTLEGHGSAATFEEESATVTPPVGAGPVRFSEIVVLPPVLNALTEAPRDAICVGMTVRLPLAVEAAVVPVTVSAVFALVQPKVAKTPCSNAPAGTVIVPGRERIVAFELVIATGRPPAGAGPFKYAFTRIVCPPDVDTGEM
jgi:hypothetical protein